MLMRKVSLALVCLEKFFLPKVKLIMFSMNIIDMEILKKKNKLTLIIELILELIGPSELLLLL